jgi:hypothetical protein
MDDETTRRARAIHRRLLAERAAETDKAIASFNAPRPKLAEGQVKTR